MKSADAAPAKVADARPGQAADAKPPKAGGGDAAAHGGREVRIGNTRLAAPKGWVRERPPLGFVLAQFSLPRVVGDGEDAQLTVTAAAETTPRSINRLREQLKEEGGESSVEQLRIAGNEVLLVESSGDDDEAGNDSVSAGQCGPLSNLECPGDRGRQGLLRQLQRSGADGQGANPRIPRFSADDEVSPAGGGKVAFRSAKGRAFAERKPTLSLPPP